MNASSITDPFRRIARPAPKVMKRRSKRVTLRTHRTGR